MVVVLLVLLCACSSGAGGDLDAGDRRVVVFNYCGNVCAAGGDGGASFVVDLVAASGADAVLLQEVCRSQATHLADELGFELHYATTFLGDLGGRNRCAGGDYGLAVLAPTIDEVWVEPLPNPGLGARQLDERSMPCASVGGGAAVCTTHLVRAENDAAAHAAQIHAFAERTAALAGDHPDLVVAGDLNDDPPSLPGFLTAGAGVDHVLATGSAYRSIDVTRRSCGCSDHDALVVTLVRRPAT